MEDVTASGEKTKSNTVCLENAQENWWKANGEKHVCLFVIYLKLAEWNGIYIQKSETKTSITT